MNIKNILAIMAIMFLHLSTQAQEVIKQIEDSSDELTTVVIKGEDESDIDILNEQFDLDEMGMHQVVRITTGGTVVLDEPKPEVPEQTPSVAPVENPEPVQQEVVLAKVTQEQKAPQQKKEVKETIKKKPTETKVVGKSASNSYSSKNSNRRTAFKPYYSKKRFKKKKRKKRSRRSKRKGSCYSF